MNDKTSKVEVLSILSEQGEADAAEVAQLLDITYETAAMALPRAYRAGLVGRSGHRGAEMFRYTLTEKGFERLRYLAGNSRNHRAGTLSFTTSHKGDSDMRVKKVHSGVFHCARCGYEVELTSEASLKCEDCGERLSTGPLPEEDEYDEDDLEEDEED